MSYRCALVLALAVVPQLAAGDAPEMMQRGEAQTRLDFMVGEWEMRSPRHGGVSRSTIRWLPGGVWLEQHSDIAETPIGPMFGMAYFGWDAAEGEYVRHWMDNQSTVVLTQRGRFVDEKALELTGSFTWTDGTIYHQRLRFVRTDDGWRETAWMGTAPDDLPLNHDTLMTPATATAHDDAGSPAPPEWLAEHVAFLTADGGRWITDNAAYKNDQEPFDAYGLEWRPGLGGHGMTGRLFGLRDGDEVATFWEFRMYWHPGERQVYLVQFGGNGVVGIGTIERTGPGTTRMAQDFFAPDGTRSSVGHESTDVEAGEHVTRSFDIQPDGTWKKRRVYTWRRESS